MDIYLTQENYKSLCEFFDINYQPIEDLHPNLTHFQNYIVFDRTGIPHTKETKEKISKAHTGKKLSDETKEKIKNINIGNKHTDDAKKKVSDSLKEQYANGTRTPHIFNHDDKWLESIKKHILGKKHATESIQKMREVQNGKIISQEQRDKIRKILTKERITKIINCKNCNKEFEIIVIKDSKNKNIKKYCCAKCSYAANSTRNKKKTDKKEE